MEADADKPDEKTRGVSKSSSQSSPGCAEHHSSSSSRVHEVSFNWLLPRTATVNYGNQRFFKSFYDFFSCQQMYFQHCSMVLSSALCFACRSD